MTVTKMRKRRISMGLSQKKLGELAAMSRPDVSFVENCQRLPFKPEAKRLAKILHLQPTELQEIEEEA